MVGIIGASNLASNSVSQHSGLTTLCTEQQCCKIAIVMAQVKHNVIHHAKFKVWVLSSSTAVQLGAISLIR